MKTKFFNQNQVKLLIDVLTFAAFLMAMDPVLTGIPVHEWLSLALAAVIVVHLLLNWNWIREITRRFFGSVTGRSRLNYFLNLLLLVDGTLLMFSGILISQAILPAFGISLPHVFFWRWLHSLTADLSVIILGLHLGLHWSWIVNCLKKTFSRSPACAVPGKGKEVRA